jgi:hypothetical protein
VQIGEAAVEEALVIALAWCGYRLALER